MHSEDACEFVKGTVDENEAHEGGENFLRKAGEVPDNGNQFEGRDDHRNRSYPNADPHPHRKVLQIIGLCELEDKMARKTTLLTSVHHLLKLQYILQCILQYSTFTFYSTFYSKSLALVNWRTIWQEKALY